jgi:hypothetical protein
VGNRVTRGRVDPAELNPPRNRGDSALSERNSRRWVRQSVRALRWVVTVTLVLLVPGCRWPWESEVGPITGTVRYPQGERANVAFVYVFGQPRSYTDWNGRYRLIVRGSVGDTVTVVAYDFCRGTCGGSSG